MNFSFRYVASQSLDSISRNKDQFEITERSKTLKQSKVKTLFTVQKLGNIPRLDGGNSILEDRFSSSLPIEAPHTDTQTNDDTTNTFSMPGNVPQTYSVHNRLRLEERPVWPRVIMVKWVRLPDPNGHREDAPRFRLERFNI